MLSRGLTGHAGETAIFMLEIGVKCWRFITLFLMLNISTDLPHCRVATRISFQNSLTFP